MSIQSGFCRVATLLLFAVVPPFCFAVETHVWEQSDQGDFARGRTKSLSIRSDGHLALAPSFKELDSTTIPYLWALAQDSKGTVYYAGGAPTGGTTKIFALAKNGKPKVYSELTGLEVHALAVDAQDRVYAAVLPDAKIYRIDSSGKPQLFFDSKCKYIWSMVFDHSGNLFVATGDSGLIFKVGTDGKGSQFFDTRESHARSMILDSAGNLIIGTEPSGLVIRVSPSGEGFILYQTAKREVTAVAERDGKVYAASVGNRGTGSAAPGAPPVLPAPAPPVLPTGSARTGTAPPSQPSVGSLNANVTGGSELYCIQKDGFAERIWSSPTELAYTVAFDPSGRPLVGTGNKGIIYRIESNQLSTQLLDAPPTQVTSFLQSRGGEVYVTTGNVGNVYVLGPALQDSGTLESEVLDANQFAYWGKVHLNSELRGGQIGVEVRSGNVNHPENNWSPWSKVEVNDRGGSVTSPPARFLQYRLTFHCSPSGESPDLSSIDIAYLPKNIAPTVEAVEIAPFNYRQAPSSPLEKAAQPSGSPTSISLAPVGQRRSGGGPTVIPPLAKTTLEYNKGFVTVRWAASDLNGDQLQYKVELRPKDGKQWRLLKDKIQDLYYAFDSTAFADGKYVARVTASDAAVNIAEQALTSTLESEPFTIDNTPPEISDFKASTAGGKLKVIFTATDGLSWLDKAEISLNGGEWSVIEPVNKVTDSRTLHYELDPGSCRSVSIRVYDENDNVVVKQLEIP
jgi:hypothetical protein